MDKRHYRLELEEETVLLRLTAAGQKRLREEFQEEVLETVLAAATDSGRMASLLTAALSWKGSGNTIRDGGELYDRLVDEGWSGQVQFGGLALDIAAASGLLNREQVEQMKASMERVVRQAFRELAEGEAEPGEA